MAARREEFLSAFLQVVEAPASHIICEVGIMILASMICV